MTRQRLVSIGRQLWKQGWQTRMAEALEIDGRTIRRYVSGAAKIPGPVALALECMARERNTGVVKR